MNYQIVQFKLYKERLIREKMQNKYLIKFCNCDVKMINSKIDVKH